MGTVLDLSVFFLLRLVLFKIQSFKIFHSELTIQKSMIAIQQGMEKKVLLYSIDLLIHCSIDLLIYC